MSGVQWGDVSSWVGSGLTGGALLISAVGLNRERRRTQAERDERAEARRREQANLVTAWVDRMGIPSADDLERWREPENELNGVVDTAPIGWIAVVAVRNSSNRPVYDVQYSASAGVKGTPVGWLAVIPPSATAEAFVPYPSPPRSSWIMPAISFTDAEGAEWLRDANGTLRARKPGDFFQQDPGAWDSVDAHPTLALPHPRRLLGENVTPDSGRVTFPSRGDEA